MTTQSAVDTDVGFRCCRFRICIVLWDMRWFRLRRKSGLWLFTLWVKPSFPSPITRKLYFCGTYTQKWHKSDIYICVCPLLSIYQNIKSPCFLVWPEMVWMGAVSSTWVLRCCHNLSRTTLGLCLSKLSLSHVLYYVFYLFVNSVSMCCSAMSCVQYSLRDHPYVSSALSPRFVTTLWPWAWNKPRSHGQGGVWPCDRN